MSSADYYSSSRKRDKSPDDHSRRPDRDRDHDKERHSSSSLSMRQESSPSQSSRHYSDEERGDKRESSSLSSRRSDKDKDRHRDDRDSKKSSRTEDDREKDKDRSKHSSSSSLGWHHDRFEPRSESLSNSGDSGSGSESEDDELVKQAKSMIWNLEQGLDQVQVRFTKNIAQEDQNHVDSVGDSNDTMTNIRFANEVSRQTGISTTSSQVEQLHHLWNYHRDQNLSCHWILDPDGQELLTKASTGDIKTGTEQKSYRKSNETDLEELVPKARGREAMLEK
ncbi:hypothetical protein CPB97_005622 [Podila verticillata]|nr:hypothetical protein CPB97_005622 [Podila verticillata]